MGRSLGVAAALAAGLALCAGTAAASAQTLDVRGSAEQVQVTGARAGQTLTLTKAGKRVAHQKAGSLGGAVFRNVRPGGGYRVGRSRPVRVLTLAGAPPSTKFYNQRIPRSGYGYLTTRDGTQLAIDVHLPPGVLPPYPTLVEYSGYGYANPAGGESSIAQVATLLGYAVVDVNMRGTGCSGGAFDYFEPLQGLDGYDVVETVARQPWVMHHRPGMMGISYGGISQLFTARNRPPSLAAITPLSVIDNTQTTLYPGGILNTGFALSWAKDRVHDALPATKTGGQAWALKRINGGDRTCKSNQDLHPEAVDLLKKTAQNAHYVPSVADPLSPITFVNRITAPTFLACQFTDEQTGGHCAALADHFTGTKTKYLTFTNGLHIDSLDPSTFNRWYDFLELYVAHRAPNLSLIVKAAAPLVFQSAMGVGGLTLPPDPVQGKASYQDALNAYDSTPPVRVLFDNGAGDPAKPNTPGAAYEHDFARFPAPGTRAHAWQLSGAQRFTWSKASRPANDFSGSTSGGTNGLWTNTPNYHWTQPPAGSVASWTTAPLTASETALGAGFFKATITSSVPDVDLQVTVSELRPDGRETFVQSGWLRASDRKLDAKKSSALAPVLSLRAKDAEPLPTNGKPQSITVPLYYQGHAYRAGSRIRVTVGPPRGDQPVWAFADTVPKSGTARITLAGASLTLPVVPGLSVPTPLPACPSLRGEPCR